MVAHITRGGSFPWYRLLRPLLWLWQDHSIGIAEPVYAIPNALQTALQEARSGVRESGR